MWKFLFCSMLLALMLQAITINGQINEITFSFKINNNSFSSVGKLLTAYPDIKVNTPNSIVKAVNGSTSNNSSYDNIEGFYVSSKIFRYFPKNIDIFFKNLLGIEISYSELKFISKNDLKPFQKLMSLNLKNNHLTFIEDDVFDNNPLVLNLELSGNPLIYISPKAFKNFVAISNIGIDKNLCSDLRFAYNYQEAQNLLDKLKISDCANSENIQLSYAIQRFSNFNGKNSSNNEISSNCSQALVEKDNKIWNLEHDLQLCNNNSNQNSTQLENKLQLCMLNASKLQQDVDDLNKTANGYLQNFNNCSESLDRFGAVNLELDKINESLMWELGILIEVLNSANFTIHNLTEKLNNCEKSLEELNGWNSTTINPETEDSITTDPHHSTADLITTSSPPNNSTENQTENPDSEEIENSSEDSNENEISRSSEESKEHIGAKHKIKEEKFVEILLKIKSKYLKKYAKE